MSTRVVAVEMTENQFAALQGWAENCESTPEEMLVALAMNSLRQTTEKTYRRSRSSSLFALETFINQRRHPLEVSHA